MTRSELIDLMADGQSQLSAKDVELAVKLLIDHMAETLSSGERIEIRGLAVSLCTIGSLARVAIPEPATRWRCVVSMCRTSNREKSCASA